MNLILGAALGLLGGGAFYCRAEARQQSSWGPSWKDMSSLQYLLFCRWYAARNQQPDHSHLSEARQLGRSVAHSHSDHLFSRGTWGYHVSSPG